MKWQDGRGSHNPGYFPFWSGQMASGQTTLRILTLENAFLTIEVAPEVGGAVAGVKHKPSGRDMFYREDAVKTCIPFWESGVKASFPYPEHGIRIPDQPAAWRVVAATSGVSTVATWMEFSRFAGPDQRRMFGRYSPLTLGQFVSLAPDTARVDIRYRVSNPCLYKFGRRVWNDAIFPRWERSGATARGTNPPELPDDARWIYPVAWASDHSGAKLRRVMPDMLLLVDRGTSLFAWDRAFGFDGIYYPSSDVNRLRLSDPREAPGAKLWWPNMPKASATNEVRHPTGNIAEIWGGLDCVFEGVEQWIEPGETAEMTLSYSLVSGVGEVQYADRSCAIARAASPSGDVWSAVSFTPVAAAVLHASGKESAGPCGPTTPLSVTLPAGASNVTVSLALGARTVTCAFPLAIPDGTNEHERIRTACSGPDTSERTGHAFDRGLNWASALRDSPRPSVKHARLLCLMGKTDEAASELNTCLGTDPGDGEGWHLLGAICTEGGKPSEAAACFDKALAADRPYASARLGLALTALARNDFSAAAAQLDKLTAERPANFTARLLRAWISVSAREPDRRERLAALSGEDPSDPRVAWVQMVHDGDERNQESIARLLQEPGAAARLTEFQAMTRGQYRHPARPVLW
jgi:hypothetical protein